MIRIQFLVLFSTFFVAALLLLNAPAGSHAHPHPHHHHHRRRLAPEPLDAYSLKGACPCADTSSCAPLINKPPLADREYLMYQTNRSNYVNYNPQFVTTVALFNGLDAQMICWAHKRGIRVVASTDGVPPAQLHNSTAVKNLISNVLENVKDNFLDGINIDFEYPIDSNADSDALLSMVTQLTAAVKNLNKNLQVTMDLAWSAYNRAGAGVDGRNYPYRGLIDVVDAAALMFYDESSQIWPDGKNSPPCFAEPNSDMANFISGVDSFTSLFSPYSNITSKLIAGLPFYFYAYSCLNTENFSVDHPPPRCQIKSVPFRNVSCSDAAGAQVPMNEVYEIYGKAKQQQQGPVSKWTINTGQSFASFWQQAEANAGEKSLKLFVGDSAETLAGKMSAAGADGRQMRGISIWSVDMLYTGKYFTPADAAAVWNAFENF